MKKLASLITVCLLLLGVGANAQNQADQDAAMKAWEKYMMPGEGHQKLAKDNGEWTYEMAAWMDPQSEPMKSTGSCENKMILGGRYQQSTFKGTFMGQPFEGISITGYDNAKKVYQSTWIDNMGTGIMMSEGKWDESTKSITFTGKGYDPAQGKDYQVKSVMKWPDANTQVMEMFMIQDGGKEVKTMEMKARKK